MSLHRFFILTFIVTLPALFACSPAEEDANKTPGDIPTGRLPQTAEPTHYRLNLRIDPRKNSFSGQVFIDLKLNETTDSIWLHGNGLDVKKVEAILPDGKTIAGNYQQAAAIGVAKVTFAERLAAGELSLFFDYSAFFNTSLEGLYKVTADTDDYVFTQFEATSARLAFPGFDEPAFKVPFDIALEVPAEHKAVTNTPAQQETIVEGMRRIQFQTTKPLPTYLIAFAVGPLDEVNWEAIPASNFRNQSIPLRGYAVRGKGQQLHYALEHTQDIVLALENYFGIAYPYAKLDILAVPDFAAGAMENAGAITYREQLLLMDDTAPAAQKLRYASVHAHELAHQWFGNLVTPVWWDDIWLNEAFATWMAGSTMHRLDPELGYRQRMLNSALNSMQLDRLVSARQVRQPVTQHEEIGAAFDGITYQKGGAVLSMLERFVGVENFRQGINNYLNEFRFGNATARDFVRSIAATRPDLEEGLIEQAFFSFLEQPGTPLVKLEWNCDNGATTVSIAQERYLPLGSDGDSNKQWLLPLCLTAISGDRKQTHCEIVDKTSVSFGIEMSSPQDNGQASCPDTIIPNADAAGYYRYSLSADHWKTLLSNDLLSEAEQLSAADSLGAAFYAGHISAGDYVELLPVLLRHDNVQVLTAPLSELNIMHREMVDPKQRPAFAQQLKALYQKVYANVQLDKSLHNPDELQLRNAMFRLYALVIKDPNLREQLLDKAVRYTGYKTDQKLHPDVLDVNVREVALSVAANMEGEPFVNLLLQHFHQSSDALLREELLRAMTAADSPGVLAELRELSLSEAVRDNEVSQILGPLMNDVDKRDATWQWIRAHMDQLIERQPSWTKGSVVSYAAGFCSEERYREIETELTEQFTALERGPRSLANTLESIELCSALVNYHKDSVKQFMAK
jgi:alanyl aminopeptidase